MLTLRWFLLLVLLPGLAYASLVRHVGDSYWSDTYDGHFRKYTKHYFGPHVDWRWFKAQGIAESGLQPDASSSAGAKGIMQILPATYEDIRDKNPHFTNIDEPRWNIAAGIYYDRMLYRKWKKGLPTEERLAFAMASYNAGYRNVLRAFRRAQKVGDVKSWEQVAPHAPGETRFYVKRIRRLMQAD
ncbi:MAG: transglycosylase SLT domain-containing protein [Candidatus Thiodiazotropha sp. (ex Semelilucina semeliformis)]|nr:transglycosylase SLT domain-containing protein [Candidatus Thiodiazotropha sp. (ex Myrtea spinifera)]MCU7807653.1 transglycosylase SLT domain-containing protein [Candidatus Thiodiazotropha sp. (ex Semelilucina semeliformis)]